LKDKKKRKKMKTIVSIVLIILLVGCSTLRNQHKKENGWVIISIYPTYDTYSLYRYNVVVKSLKDGSTMTIQKNLPTYNVGDTLIDVE
jgi:ABC-type Zn uptake system ZnuABC Zn-binding protein ZnuA